MDNFTVSGTPIVVGDIAPSVTGTTPANGAADVAVDANITIDFSEPVTVTGNWFDIACTSNRTAIVSGGPSSFTLDPDVDFSNGEMCTVTVFALQVTDQDTDDGPDNMEADYVFSFTIFSSSPQSNDYQRG